MKKTLTTLLTAGALLAGFTQSASAQTANPAQATTNLISTSTSGLTSTGITVGVVLLVLNLTKGEQALHQYLQENRAEVMATLAAGGGTAGEDLAAMFGVDPSRRDRFARALRAHRRELSASLGQGADGRIDAGAFMERVVALMRADESLAKDLPEHLLTT
jgi:hypothetical protein